MISRRYFVNGTAAVAASPLFASSQRAAAAVAGTVAARYADDFRLGVAVANSTLDRQPPAEIELIAREFTSLTGENCMKWESVRRGDEWTLERADRLADLAGQHDMYLLGHTLVWHSQIPGSVFVDGSGEPLTRTALLDVMQQHIGTMVGRYRGRVHAWDVVNEGIDEDRGWRRSSWFSIIGDDYMEHAFRMAAAEDPAAHLIYNDYNMHDPGKREFLVGVVRDYFDRGVPIHGIGLQGHIGLDYPDLDEWEASIAAYAALGLKVHISELDIDVLPNPYQASAEISNRFEYTPDKDPYRDGLPDEIQERLADRYEEVFAIFLRHRDAIERVTFWGLHDGMSWKNGFPIRGRVNHPLLFDRRMQPKPAYYRLLEG
jgi:endo-1,4-beta-xylanase